MNRKPLRLIAAAAALCLIAAAPFVANRQSAGAMGPAVHVAAGFVEDGISVDLFLYDDITVMKGSTVTWDFPTLEVHTTTFGTPTGDPTAPSDPGGAAPEYTGGYVNSGTLLGGAQFSMIFPQVGTYEYFCVYHPFMTARVTVVEDAGDSQAALDARASAQRESALFELRSLAAQLNAKPVAVSNKPTGGRKYTLLVGGGTQKGALQQYFPAKQTITVNDTIEWVSSTFTPHSVSFGTLPPGNPFAIPVIAPASGAWDGTGPIHSGMIGLDEAGGTKFELTFGKPGTYSYYCILHEQLGQKGTIIVAAAPVAPLPPNTGEGQESARTPRTSAFIAAAMALLALGAIGLVTASRQR